AEPNRHSLLKAHLTRERLDSHKKLKTKFGGTLAHCIRSGCLNTDSPVGIYASDPDAYKTFCDLFLPIITDYHEVNEVNHSSKDFGAKSIRQEIFELDNDRIESTRVSVARSLEGLPFPPMLTQEKREKLDNMSKAALRELRGELRGDYFSLSTLTPVMTKRLDRRNLLFTNNDRFLEAAGAYKQWPDARGIYCNENKTFVAWVNESDHLQLISQAPGGDLKKVYLKLVNGVKQLENNGLRFVWKENFG
ncbi:arginine kinase, partial [Biomphalaria pfeifferi]